MTNMGELVSALEQAFPKLRVTVFDSSSMSVRAQVLICALICVLICIAMCPYVYTYVSVGYSI
jgi:hypothetical protein